MMHLDIDGDDASCGKRRRSRTANHAPWGEHLKRITGNGDDGERLVWSVNSAFAAPATIIGR